MFILVHVLCELKTDWTDDDEQSYVAPIPCVRVLSHISVTNNTYRDDREFVRGGGWRVESSAVQLRSVQTREKKGE